MPAILVMSTSALPSTPTVHGQIPKGGTLKPSLHCMYDIKII